MFGKEHIATKEESKNKQTLLLIAWIISLQNTQQWGATLFQVSLHCYNGQKMQIHSFSTLYHLFN